MRILFAGTPAVAVPLAQALLASMHEVVGVVTQPPRPAGRGKGVHMSPMHTWAMDNDLPVLTPESINQESAHADILRLKPDIACVVAYGQLLRSDTLKLLHHGWLNVHFSLLPLWRGAAPVQRCIMAGDDVSGCSIFQLDEGMDTGPVFSALTMSLGPSETAGNALDRLANASTDLLVQTLDGIAAGTLIAVEQQHELASYAPKIATSEGNIKWHHPALGIDRWIRGLTPTPGAWTTFAGSRLGLGPVQLEPSLIMPAGHLQISKKDVLVGTGSHCVRLTQVKPQGKAWMDATDWARGLRDVSPRFDYVA